MAREQARIAARENGMRLRGMGDQRLYAAIEWKRGAMPCPRPAGIRTVPDAPAGRSKTYAVVRCHTLTPFVSIPASPRKQETLYRRGAKLSQLSGMGYSVGSECCRCQTKGQRAAEPIAMTDAYALAEGARLATPPEPAIPPRQVLGSDGKYPAR